MFCKYCGKKIEDDSIFCKFCRKQQNKTYTAPVGETVKRDGTYTAPDGKTYKVKDRVLYDDDGWDVGRVPEWWG